MNLESFKHSMKGDQPPPGLTLALEGLWFAGKGDWETAHERAQAEDGRDGAWVHAYVHRWEGDAANAEYWYRRAGKPVASGALEQEWEELVRELVSALPPTGAPQEA
jgi:hypothetical protein